MRLSAAIYLALGVLGIAAAVLVPLTIYKSGTQAFPIWTTVASPGPLSAAHAFLGVECESCHTPDKGIAAASCITCHASEPRLLAKQSTAFHATINDCRGCHIEHQDADQRPIKMDHSVLVGAGFRAADTGTLPKRPATLATAVFKHLSADVTGGATVADGQVLNCMSCHGFRDKHQGLFGQECANCHATTTWKINGYLHPSPKSEECNQCHQAPPSHYMMHFTMMDQGISGQRTARVEQCFACHQTDSFNDIRGIGWFKMH